MTKQFNKLFKKDITQYKILNQIQNNLTHFEANRIGLYSLGNDVQLSIKNHLCKVKCLIKLCQYEKADLELIRLNMIINQSHYELRPLINIRYKLIKAVWDFKNSKIQDILEIEDIVEPLREMVKEQYGNEVYLKAKLEYLTAKMFKKLGFTLEAKNILS